MDEFRAAILESSGKPLVVDTIQAAEHLKAGQVRVKVRYSGICGAQLNEIDAVKGPDKFLPHLLGHEGIGEVVEVGPLVRTVGEGDTVVLHWMPGTGIESHPARYKWNTTTVNAGWVTTLSEVTIVSENRVTKFDSNLDPRFAPLLGCAATTAAGVIGRDAALRLGESVVVLGTGGVGLLVVEAARLSGGFPIVGVDLVAERLEVADQFGATHTFNSRVEGKGLESTILRSLGDAHPDVVIETTGNHDMIELGYRLVSGGGRCVLVGVPHHDEPAMIHTLPLHFDTILTGSKGGGARPEVDIARLAKLAVNGNYRLQDLPITLLPLDQVNEGVEAVRKGLPGRVIIDMQQV